MWQGAANWAVCDAPTSTSSLQLEIWLGLCKQHEQGWQPEPWGREDLFYGWFDSWVWYSWILQWDETNVKEQVKHRFKKCCPNYLPLDSLLKITHWMIFVELTKYMNGIYCSFSLYQSIVSITLTVAGIYPFSCCCIGFVQCFVCYLHVLLMLMLSIFFVALCFFFFFCKPK